MTIDDSPPPSRDTRPAVRTAGPRTQPVRRIASHELFAGSRELVIAHDGRDYRLRITQNGKLILTA